MARGMSRRSLKLFMECDQIRKATPQQHMREQHLSLLDVVHLRALAHMAQRQQEIKSPIQLRTVCEVQVQGLQC